LRNVLVCGGSSSGYAQGRSGPVRVGAGRLPSFDPATDEILGELPEAAARIIEFVGLRMASCQEGLVQQLFLTLCLNRSHTKYTHRYE
jgi:hypothetical protein